MQKEGGRDGSASGEPVRYSRRVQGLLPEEHGTLDEMERDNRKRNAALRKAAQEARNASTSGEPQAESADSDAHQASSAKALLENRKHMKTEPSAEDRVTDSHQRPDEEEIVQEKIEVKVERPLSTVQEETASEDMKVSPALTETSLPEVQLAHATSESQTSRNPVTVDARDEDMTLAQTEGITGDQAKFYVASQFQRWKEALAGRPIPPEIRYDWPFGKPDSQAYYLATLQTSRYLEERMSMASQAVCCNTFGLALDLTGLMIPVERLSPIECVAIIQTLLAESGFELQNVIPVWSDARILNIHSELIQLVCDDLQRVLSVELLEWRQLTSEATRRFLSDEELDVLMTIPGGETPKSAVLVDDYPEHQDVDDSRS
ncbi:hypothetical protein PHMEG_00024398 [Phytophthora megakarya]|uniref:Uncharacterized protein n=1 Tax=Phytophthora megakarya TaxID=4795 RepID=A0A225VGA6_9STRA|nr:hypothetical protein PHMEG_00024398 [Phytophthora megakarya]